MLARCLDEGRENPVLGLQRYEKARLDRAHLAVAEMDGGRHTLGCDGGKDTAHAVAIEVARMSRYGATAARATRLGWCDQADG